MILVDLLYYLTISSYYLKCVVWITCQALVSVKKVVYVLAIVAVQLRHSLVYVPRLALGIYGGRHMEWLAEDERTLGRVGQKGQTELASEDGDPSLHPTAKLGYDTVACSEVVQKIVAPKDVTRHQFGVCLYCQLAEILAALKDDLLLLFIPFREKYLSNSTW